MKILLGLAITLTVFLMAQPIPVPAASDESTNSAKNDDYAYIFQASKILSDKIESLIKKALPHMPKSPEYEVYRENLKEYLQLKRDYKRAELTEDCGEKALELFERHDDFIRYYVKGISSGAEIRELIEILNEYGMQTIKDYLKEIRDVSPIDVAAANKYIIEHCKPSETK